jgi:hypothetical protein
MELEPTCGVLREHTVQYHRVRVDVGVTFSGTSDGRYNSGVRRADPLAVFHPASRDWFSSTFAAATPAQLKGWPAICACGDSTLILAPTGSGKTLTALSVSRIAHSRALALVAGRFREH